MKNCKGFTLLELVIVIILIGVIAAIALPRISDNSIKNYTFVQQTTNALNYSQRLAVSTRCEIRVVVDSTTDTYQVYRRSGGSHQSCGNGEFTEKIRNPLGGFLEGKADKGVDVQQGAIVTYDMEGKPIEINTTIIIGGINLVVQKGTGYVQY